jgi:hypothetical protein
MLMQHMQYDPSPDASVHTRDQTQCGWTCRPMSKIIPGAILLVMAYGIVSSDVFGITAPILGWSAAGSGTVADSLTSSGGSAVAAAVSSSAAAQRTEYSDPFKRPWGYRPLVAQPCRWAAVPAVRWHAQLAWGCSSRHRTA